MRVAVMQGYFVPYEGYFRLLSQADIFVCYDCVQFPRRGWMHRNKLLNRNGELKWLTLPLAHAPFDVKVKDLVFAPDAKERMADEMRRFPAFDDGRLPEDLRSMVSRVGGSFVDYAVSLLELCCEHLSIKPNIQYSSVLNIPAHYKAQDRILEICKMLGATHYLNSPGGRGLYDAKTFADAGIELEFLSDWDGPMESILQTLSQGAP